VFLTLEMHLPWASDDTVFYLVPAILSSQQVKVSFDDSLVLTIDENQVNLTCTEPIVPNTDNCATMQHLPYCLYGGWYWVSRSTLQSMADGKKVEIGIHSKEGVVTARLGEGTRNGVKKFRDRYLR